MSIDDERVSGCLDFAGEATIGGVILQKMGISLCIGQIVDGDDFEVMRMTLKYSLQRLTPDATKTINTYTSCHLAFLLFALRSNRCCEQYSTNISKTL